VQASALAIVRAHPTMAGLMAGSVVQGGPGYRV